MIIIQNFYKASIITVILLYILVLVGGFVRITESGDDCPDWPWCYGGWFPPLSIDDIPDKYIKKAEHYNDLNKNGIWDNDEDYCDIGSDKCPDPYEDGGGGCYCDFLNNPESCQSPELIKKSDYIIYNQLDPNKDNCSSDGNGEFDSADTIEDLQKKVSGSKIEYFNRLVGVILGISMLFTFYKSFYVFRYDKIIFYGSLSSFLFIIIAGWFGGQIANNCDGTNVMHQHSVSIHLYIAILTIISLVYTTNRGFLLLYPDCEKKTSYSNESIYIFFAILILNLLLIFSGSFIRTFIDDDLIKQLPYFLRMERYVYSTGLIKFVHPILGFSMLGLLGILWNHIMNISNPSNILKMLVKVLLILVGLQVIIGEGLRFNFIHESFRLYHLWISTVILGIIIISNQRIRHSK